MDLIQVCVDFALIVLRLLRTANFYGFPRLVPAFGTHLAEISPVLPEQMDFECQDVWLYRICDTTCQLP